MNAILITLSFLASIQVPGNPHSHKPSKKAMTFLTSPKRSEVSPRLVCRVKDAIRGGGKAWNEEMCKLLASEFSKSKRRGLPPILGFSVAVNESDLREDVESPTYSRVVRNKEYKVKDGGLMQVQCIFDKKGVCINGLAKGLTLKELKDPATNIRVGLDILAKKMQESKKRKNRGADWVADYNGGGRYSGRIAAIVAACHGVQLRVEDERMQKLTGQIIRAVKSMDPTELAMR